MLPKSHRNRTYLSVTLGLHRNNIYKEVSRKENFLYCDTSCPQTLPLPIKKKTLNLGLTQH